MESSGLINLMFGVGKLPKMIPKVPNQYQDTGNYTKMSDLRTLKFLSKIGTTPSPNRVTQFRPPFPRLELGSFIFGLTRPKFGDGR